MIRPGFQPVAEPRGAQPQTRHAANRLWKTDGSPRHARPCAGHPRLDCRSL